MLASISAEVSPVGSRTSIASPATSSDCSIREWPACLDGLRRVFWGLGRCMASAALGDPADGLRRHAAGGRRLRASSWGRPTSRRAVDPPARAASASSVALCRNWFALLFVIAFRLMSYGGRPRRGHSYAGGVPSASRSRREHRHEAGRGCVVDVGAPWHVARPARCRRFCPTSRAMRRCASRSTCAALPVMGFVGAGSGIGQDLRSRHLKCYFAISHDEFNWSEKVYDISSAGNTTVLKV